MSGLLQTAERLAGSAQGQPTQPDLRRAVSTAYYAVFDALARSGADLLAGAEARNAPAWVQVYRALEHGQARAALELVKAPDSGPGAADFAKRFLRLQFDRLRADYDPSVEFTRPEALASIGDARLAIELLSELSADERRALVVGVWFSRRRR